MATKYAIRAQGLSKSFRIYKKAEGLAGSIRSFFQREYENVRAVSDFDLTLEPGEFIGLLGPNGAGKTTVIKMCTGIIVPSAGELSVIGHQPFQRATEFRRKIALVMGQKSQLWWDIPAMDSFLLLQRYYEIEESTFRARLGELSDVLNVGKLLNVHVRKLSLGERMKMELMASLLHQPDIMFLDEPTIGLDLVAQESIREFLRQYQQKHGTTIILTSHYMADVSALCKRVVLIFGGTKCFDDSINVFEGILGNEKCISLEFEHPVAPDSPLLSSLDPKWDEGYERVDIRVKEEELRSTLQQIFEQLPVTNIHSDKIPIERVMGELFQRPELLMTSKS